MIRSGAIVALLPYLGAAAFVLIATVAAIVKAIRRRPYVPPDIPGEQQAIDEWRKRGGGR